MPVERIHPSKRLLAPVASVRPQVQMKSFMALAIVLSRESLFAAGPLAFEWSFLIMRSKMALQIEVARERATASRNRAYERCLALSSSFASLGGSGSSHLLTLDF